MVSASVTIESDNVVLPTTSPPVSLSRMIRRNFGMISMPSFSYCALMSDVVLTLCSRLGPALAFGPSSPGTVSPISAENLREFVDSMLVTLTVSLSVAATV